MHRSGTSLVARMMMEAGLTLGSDLIPPSHDNPAGFFEHKEVVALNDRVLEHLGIRWDSPCLVPEQPAPEWFFSTAADIWSRVFAGSDHWCVKDPRMMRLLPWWFAFFQHMNMEPGIVWVVRHPDEVAQSLIKRNNMDLQTAYALWIRSQIECMQATRARATTVVTYDEVILNPFRTAKRIASTLKIHWPHEGQDLKQKLIGAVDPSLRHHQSAKGHSEDPFERWAIQLFDLLATGTMDPSSWQPHISTLTLIDQFPVSADTANRALRAQNQSLNQFIDRLVKDKETLDEFAIRKDREIHQFKLQESELRKEIRRLTDMVANLDKDLTDVSERSRVLSQQVVDLEAMGNQLREQLSEAELLRQSESINLGRVNMELGRLSSQLDESRNEYDQLMRQNKHHEEALADLTRERDALQRELERIQTNLDKVMQSKSFRALSYFIKFKLE